MRNVKIDGEKEYLRSVKAYNINIFSPPPYNQKYSVLCPLFVNAHRINNYYIYI